MCGDFIALNEPGQAHAEQRPDPARWPKHHNTQRTGDGRALNNRALQNEGQPSALAQMVWSRYRCDAVDLKEGVFNLSNPNKIAASLKHSAERSKPRKSDPYRSAMSMLTCYMNRGGRNLSASRKRTLNGPRMNCAQLGQCRSQR
jgi:hypothetical protein